MRAEVLDGLAALLRYPDEECVRTFDDALAVIEVEDLELAESLAPLARSIGELSLMELEEQYTRTFDINPLCTLEIGWQLYGEDYNRGAFLVRMRSLMRHVGVEESAELPDHLAHVLPVLGRASDAITDDLARAFTMPAMRKMLDAFDENENPYRSLLAGIHAWLGREFGTEEAVPGAASVSAGPYAGTPDLIECLPLPGTEES